MCGVGGAVFVIGGNIGIHHRLDGFLLGFAVLVEVYIGTVTIKSEAEPLKKHHSLRVFEFVIGFPQTGAPVFNISNSRNLTMQRNASNNSFNVS